ncbi:SDR family oxidoreductase [Bacillus sp. DTU_2020_1000418_1_SI_GHA_SEK_038]|uniref:SDR family oxidoreductase n=1 Tax=Bacillus sp. DTU_2020_1000418_1_SI_GHA_SEK_038 TaxID=3077585 RepID=UPI0028EA4A7B|nr:SDR family oxidoreductase [Bacillus sp. DTU_2020_1000418_1_SI_GHA_SEK_038]WNS75171.1 SDR family oxidoreductase [Bacillus sp. DTU_2020_1000418_1_SI_GHA_SEK_038]
MDLKVVVITGAGSGLGASLAKKYSTMGCHVCLIGRRASKLEETAKQLTNSYSIYELDVTSKSSVEKVMWSIKEEVGPIDLLINNAGLGVFDLAENLSEEHVHGMIDINLKGTIFCTQEVLPSMKERNQGIIVNVVSTAGIEGKVTESVYCASKFGVRGFTESLALELNDTGIRVFGAYMGGMKSPFWEGILTEEKMKDLMDPDDIADIIIDNAKLRKNLIVTEVVIKNKI